MKFKQTVHRERIISRFAKEFRAKFNAGAKEHGGDLRDMTALQLARNAKEEAIDEYCYLDVLEEKLSDVQKQS